MSIKSVVASKKGVFIISVTAGILILAVSLILLGKAPQKTNRTYAEAALDYAAQLKENGLVAVKQIDLNDGSEAFITLLVPGTGEVTPQDIEQVTELTQFTVEVFENHKGLRSDDISIAFQRPTDQKIIFVSRPDGLPAPLGFMGEMTVTSPDQPGVALSIVNLAGTPKTPGRAYTTAWSTIQALCLGYGSWQNQAADSTCNIISANAAAGWTGVDRDVAKNWLNVGGSTDLEYLGRADYQYRFIDFVFDQFSRR